MSVADAFLLTHAFDDEDQLHENAKAGARDIDRLHKTVSQERDQITQLARADLGADLG